MSELNINFLIIENNIFNESREYIQFLIIQNSAYNIAAMCRGGDFSF